MPSPVPRLKYSMFESASLTVPVSTDCACVVAAQASSARLAAHRAGAKSVGGRCSSSLLFDQLDLARTPRLVEERLLRAIEAQQREPALAGQRLNPVAILGVGGLGWAEINRRRAIRIRHGSW